MRIAYVTPAALSHTSSGQSELRRREDLLNEWAFTGTQVTVFDVPSGPLSIESAWDEAACVPGLVRRLVACERENFDALIIGCFGDPGLEAARELISIPVVGPCESALLLAASLGHRFSVLTVLDSLSAGQEMLAVRAGVRSKLASVRATGIPVLDLMRDRDFTRARLAKSARACVEEDRADAVLLGCMTMSFMNLAEEVSATLGVPVINTARAALKQAEILASMGLAHSKSAWPRPANFPANLVDVSS